VRSEALQLIPYAVIAAATPLGLAATVAVMRTGRLGALAFAVGVVAGQFLACGILVLVGAVAVPDRKRGHPTYEAVLELVLGVALLALAASRGRRSHEPSETSGGRTQAILDRLGRVHALTALAAGLLLGVGGPKRLVLTAFASASIAAYSLSDHDETVLVGWYTLLATVLVWAPVVAFVMLGARAARWLDRALAWFVRHEHEVTFYVLVAVGALLVGLGIARL
jgi:hypothetical protein